MTKTQVIPKDQAKKGFSPEKGWELLKADTLPNGDLLVTWSKLTESTETPEKVQLWD